MSLLENELNTKNFELANNAPEFASRREYEKKYAVTKPDAFEIFRQTAVPIEQIYLSHPTEEFSLRVRKETTSEGAIFTATLKDTGKVVNGVRERLEIETPITQQAYEYYAQSPQFPRVKKNRATIQPGVTIDFYDELHTPILEVETKDTMLGTVIAESFGDSIEDRTMDQSLDNESIAHALHPAEWLKPKESLEQFTQRVTAEIVARYVAGENQVVVGLSGMSGSGKTTVTKAIQQTITEAFGDAFKPIVISTDDYHRGKKWLEDTYGAPWTDWDNKCVYDTAKLADDLRGLANGIPFKHHEFDFATEEVIDGEEVQPSPFVLVEGLYAGSPDLEDARSLHFPVPTGIATSVGWDVRRLVINGRANSEFLTAEDRLAHQINSALPTFLSQEQPRRNTFNASMRTMGKRAAMLEAITQR